MRSQTKVRTWKSSELPSDWFKRKALAQQAPLQIENNVKAIICKVLETGDTALIQLTAKFDKALIVAKDLKVTPREIEEAYKAVSKKQVAALKSMKNKVLAFEKLTLKQAGFKISGSGITVQTVLRPIESVGCYVPGGQAAYPSTLIMTVMPAKAAEVPRIVVCSPPNGAGKMNPLVLVAADICGVNEFYKVGGAQAIAALAYGTETIKPVKKIVGPGSKYVTVAKILVSKDVAIDMPAGPSEVLVLADETANPQFIAFDMASQAEHGADSVTCLITDSEKLAEQVQRWLAKVIASAERGEIVAKALEQYGFILTCKDMAEAVELANVFAPEHIEVMARKPERLVEKITSAGLILVGSYSPVALSDYASGTNHVLPTGGFGSAYSGLSALDFARRVSVVESSKEGLQGVLSRVEVMADAENLPNHYKAVEARLKK